MEFWGFRTPALILTFSVIIQRSIVPVSEGILGGELGDIGDGGIYVEVSAWKGIRHHHFMHVYTICIVLGVWSMVWPYCYGCHSIIIIIMIILL